MRGARASGETTKTLGEGRVSLSGRGPKTWKRGKEMDATKRTKREGDRRSCEGRREVGANRIQGRGGCAVSVCVRRVVCVKSERVGEVGGGWVAGLRV